MNEYKSRSEGYRQYLEAHPEEPNKKYIERQIEILDFLAACKPDDIDELYNTGVFNDITAAYARKAMENVGIEPKKIKEVMEEIRWLHDTVTAHDII